MTNGRENPAEHRSVLVTGAARGIGLEIARALSRSGAAVVMLDRDPSVVDAAAALGPGCRGIEADLRDAEATRTTVEAAADDQGGFSIAVNNAGVFGKTPILELDVDEWDLMMEVNVRSMLVVIQAVAPAMIAAGGGRIINQASMAAKLGTPGEAHYAASKAAVVALTRVAAMELGPHGITVNSICPGYVLTDMGADTRDESQVAEWAAKSPLGRLASPQDVAEAVKFLASDEAAYITGEALNVSGGMCTW